MVPYPHALLDKSAIGVLEGVSNGRMATAADRPASEDAVTTVAIDLLCMPDFCSASCIFRLLVCHFAATSTGLCPVMYVHVSCEEWILIIVFFSLSLSSGYGYRHDDSKLCWYRYGAHLSHSNPSPQLHISKGRHYQGPQPKDRFV